MVVVVREEGDDVGVVVGGCDREWGLVLVGGDAWVCTGLEEETDDLGVVDLGCVKQGSNALVVLSVDVCSCAQEEGGRLGRRRPRCLEQWKPPTVVSPLHICPSLLHQQANNINTTHHVDSIEWRAVVHVGLVDIHTILEEQPDHLGLVPLAGNGERSAPVGRALFSIHPVAQEETDNVDVSVLAGCVERREIVRDGSISVGAVLEEKINDLDMLVLGSHKDGSQLSRPRHTVDIQPSFHTPLDDPSCPQKRCPHQERQFGQKRTSLLLSFHPLFPPFRLVQRERSQEHPVHCLDILLRLQNHLFVPPSNQHIPPQRRRNVFSLSPPPPGKSKICSAEAFEEDVGEDSKERRAEVAGVGIVGEDGGEGGGGEGERGDVGGGEVGGEGDRVDELGGEGIHFGMGEQCGSLSVNV